MRNARLNMLDPTAYVWPFFPGLDIARDIELHGTQQGVVILDGWDGIHPVPVDIVTNRRFQVGSQQSFFTIAFPEGVGIKFDKTTSFDLNSHYLNLNGEKTLMGEVYVNFFF